MLPEEQKRKVASYERLIGAARNLMPGREKVVGLAPSELMGAASLIVEPLGVPITHRPPRLRRLAY